MRYVSSWKLADFLPAILVDFPPLSGAEGSMLAFFIYPFRLGARLEAFRQPTEIIPYLVAFSGSFSFSILFLSFNLKFSLYTV
jgi:hypothetical protein